MVVSHQLRSNRSTAVEIHSCRIASDMTNGYWTGNEFRTRQRPWHEYEICPHPHLQQDFHHRPLIQFDAAMFDLRGWQRTIGLSESVETPGSEHVCRATQPKTSQIRFRFLIAAVRRLSCTPASEISHNPSESSSTFLVIGSDNVI